MGKKMIQTLQQFTTLTKKQKSAFFARHLTSEVRTRLSVAVEETAQTGRMSGGMFVYKDGIFSLGFGRNNFSPSALCIEFHTHAWEPGFNLSDLDRIGESGMPLVTLSRSIRQARSIHMFLAEPSEEGIRDLGLIYSFPSSVLRTSIELIRSMADAVSRDIEQNLEEVRLFLSLEKE
jgi:hypothetical protein